MKTNLLRLTELSLTPIEKAHIAKVLSMATWEDIGNINVILDAINGEVV